MQDPSSKSEHLKTKRAALLLSAAFCLTCFSFEAAAQQSTYSADSLMEAFKKGSKVSLKGAEITFTDVVVESKKSSVLFRSSGNHKVTCEFASPISSGNAKIFVGGMLTVVGKVRGRGLLGNVTLDDCSPALSVATVDSNSSNVAPVEPVAAQADPVPSEEQSEIPIENPSETGDTGTITSDSGPVPRKSLSPKVAVPAPIPDAEAIPGEPVSSETTEESNITGQADFPKAARPVAFYVRVVVFAGLALLVFVKLLPAFVRRCLRTSVNKSVSLEARRAAIESLLSGEKKTWRDRLKFRRAS